MVSNKMVASASEMSRPTKQIYIRTILLVASWLVLGVCGEIIGPTIGILAHNMHVTYNGIGTALAARSAGGLLTNILCGIFQKFVKNYPDLMLTISFFLPAMLLSMTPYINSLILMSIVFFVQGASGSFANMGGTDLLFKMWNNRAAAPFNIVHLGYSCGAILANLLVRPFLANSKSHVNVNVSFQLNSTLSSSISVPLDADIRVPYMIAAGLCFLIGIGHLIFFIQEQKQRQKKAQIKQASLNSFVDYAPVNTSSSKADPHSDKIKFSQYSPAIFGHGYFGYGLFLSLVFVAYMFFVAGTDQVFAKFYFSYLKFDKFGISTDGASWGIVLFWISFSIGRLFGVIICIFIPVYLCLVFIWCGGLILAIMWIIYVWILGLTATNLFVLGSVTGFILGPLFGLSFAWINQKLNVIPPLLAAILCGCGLGSLILHKIAGFIMDRDPNHFSTLITICIVLTMILYIIANFIVFFHQRSLKKLEHPVVNDVTLTVDKLNEDEQQTVKSLQGVNETL